MAKEAAEVLLVLHHDGQTLSDFQDYTLVAITAVAAHLCRISLPGSKGSRGVSTLAARYSHDEAALEQVYDHILECLRHYRAFHDRRHQFAVEDAAGMEAAVLAETERQREEPAAARAAAAAAAAAAQQQQQQPEEGAAAPAGAAAAAAPPPATAPAAVVAAAVEEAAPGDPSGARQPQQPQQAADPAAMAAAAASAAGVPGLAGDALVEASAEFLGKLNGVVQV